MLRASVSFRYHMACLLTALVCSMADFDVENNTDCLHIREDGGSWIADPHWFGARPEEMVGGSGCMGGMMYMCEPKWSAEAHPEDLGNGWSVPMFLRKDSYAPEESEKFYCNDQDSTDRGGLTGGTVGKFVGEVTWKCTKDGWEAEGRCQRARYCRARRGEIKLSPSRSLDETSLALIHVFLEVHELQRFETAWFPCKQCHAHDVSTGEDVHKCAGKVLLRCNEDDEVVEVDNFCTPAESKKKKSSGASLMEKKKKETESLMETKQDLEKVSQRFLQGDFAKKARPNGRRLKEESEKTSKWKGHKTNRRHET